MRMIKRSELEELLEQDGDIALVNVLDEDSFAAGHIPGSINIPVQSPEFRERAQSLLSPDQTIVTYCASFSCQASTQAAERLGEMGFHNVLDYKGGIQDWKEAGLPVESGMGAGKR